MACEIHSGDEMIATEMIFSGVLTDLDPAEAAGLLSALVFQVCLGFTLSPTSCCWDSLSTLQHVPGLLSALVFQVTAAIGQA